MTTTALALAKRGIVFAYADGRPVARGPADAMADVHAEVARRAALFAPLLPGKPYTPLRIVAAPPPGKDAPRMAFYGRCESCDEPMVWYQEKRRGREAVTVVKPGAHLSGSCPLCVYAIRAARRGAP